MKRSIFCYFSVLAAFIILLTIYHTEASAQNKVEGTLTFDKETFQLKNIYVFQKDDEVSVFMTETPVSPDKIPYDIVDVANEGKVIGFSVGISKSEKKISKYSYNNVIYHKAVKGWGQMRLGDFGKLAIKTFDENILEAGLSLDKPGAVTCSDCSKDYTYSYNVTFRVNLNAGKEESMKPAEIIVSGDDTPPGKAYASYYRAKMAGNIDEVKKWVVKEHVKDLDDEMGKKMIKMSMELFPKEVKIINSAISGNSAKLSVKGVTNDKGPAMGLVEMVLEDGQWKVNTDKWK